MFELRSQQRRVSQRLGVRAALVCFSVVFPILSGANAAAQERPLEELRRIDEGVDALIKRVSPSVV